ncbi:MAG: hypothetical protein AAFO69_07040 [Bacteroidota bacterium]
MRREISWSKNMFGNTYKLRGNDGKMGQLEINMMSRGARGSIGGQRYLFRAKGLFSRNFEMICTKTGAIIANIKFNIWGLSVRITTKDNHYTWKHSNFWQTKWHIKDNESVCVNGSSNGFMLSGSIVFRSSAEQMALAGLFIKNRIVRMNSGG